MSTRLPRPRERTAHPKGRFELLRRLGSGASATVFAVRDRQQRAVHALKLLREGADEALLRAEYAELSRLRSPHLVAVHDLVRLEESCSLGEETVIAAGRLCLLCELCEGEDPRSALARVPEPERDRWLQGLVEDLAGALEEVHGAGLVHHDLKPENVLVVPGRGAVLLDLGLATAASSVLDGARGTPRYLAPEALIGGGEPPVDLYALGATLFEICEGRPIFAASADLVRAILEETPELGARWLSSGLRALILSLLAKPPGARPSARSVLVEIARLRGDDLAAVRHATRRSLAAPTELVGREPELARIRAVLEGGAARVLLLEGPPGSGKTALLEEAVRRHRLRAAAGQAEGIELLCGPLREILQRLELPEAEARSLSLDDLALAAAARLEARAEGRRLLLELELDGGGPLARRLIEIVASDRSPRASARLLIVAETSDPGDRMLGAAAEEGSLVCRIPVGALGEEAVGALCAAMLGGEVPAGLAAQVARLSEGNPTLAVELLRLWHLEGEAGLELRFAQLEPMLARIATTLDRHELDLIAALACWHEPATPATLARLLGQRLDPCARRIASLARRQLLRIAGEAARLPTRAHVEAWRRLLEDRPALAAIHRRAVVEIQRAAASPGGSTEAPDPALMAQLARHLLALDDPRAPALALSAGRALAALHAPLEAIPLLEEALRRGPGEAALEIRETLGELCVQAGRYDQAVVLLSGRVEGEASAVPASSPRATVLRAQALQRRGDYAEAEGVLRELLGSGLGAGEDRLRATAILGRLLLGQGRTLEARQTTASELDRTREIATIAGGGGTLLEVAGLAALYQGELAEADRIFARGEDALAAGPRSQLARFVNLRGMVATSQGRPEQACDAYRRALALVEDGGDAHGRATYRVNLASGLIELGALGEALERLSAATADLEQLARTVELASAQCNLANLLLLLGDDEAAARQLDRAGRLAKRLGTRSTAAFVAMLEGDRGRVRGEPARAVHHYERALSLLEDAGSPRDRALCALSRIDALTEAGRLQEARASLERLPGIEDEPDGELRGAIAASWARLHLAGGGAVPEPCLQSLSAHCAELERRGVEKDLWRAAALLGRCLRGRAGQGEAARAALARAKTSWEGIVQRSPESHRARMALDPEVRALGEAWSALQQEEKRPAGVEATGEAHRTRRLLAINKRLNSELRLPRLLEAIMDTVIELTEAERGFLLLSGKDGTLSVKVARNIDKRSLEGAELALSRSIAERAAQTQTPIVTVDALSDGRFQQALSVSDLHLRSVLAVPLTVKGRVVGTVYIDNRLRGGVFGEAEVRLVQDVADQAAIAIENARLLGANRRKRRLIQRLNRQLARKLENKQAELLEVREELRSSKEALQARHEYGSIIGRSPRMRELFQLLDRVTETELPVVVLGESGTGKELVARAIHHHGPRSERAFVSENCAAIPETLLESVLFGHVRGAFTGADRDRKGLFEVASGGTLFLDEVGEMSPAMQTKLLRVLQNGEFRRVGGAQTLHTDVRVIAASNKDLAHLVETGRFREDLFYRLNVIQVKIPPLRERREDIPLLCDHFLEKHAAGQDRRLSAEALARLSGYAWPGNVRELENEIMRTAALAGQVILPRDLSPAIAGSAPLALGADGDLQLKARVEHLERELIAQALRLSAANHTQAAKTLGLSRFGLLKKIRRYGIGS